jgi:branched-subunit amino acid aminotransferase/4-amino-4-deoxychorismate lyase
LASEAGILFSEGRVTLEEFLKADEAILAGTTIEVLPIVGVDGRPIGNGRPGPITLRLQEAYQAAVESWLALPAALA